MKFLDEFRKKKKQNSLAKVRVRGAGVAYLAYKDLANSAKFKKIAETHKASTTRVDS